MNVFTWQIENSYHTSSIKSINDIAKLKTENQYALGLSSGGVQIVEIKATENGF